MMKIEVLGDGCPKCRSLEKNTRQAVAEAGAEVAIEVVNDPARIAHYHLLTLPGLAVDGELKSRGRLLSPAEIRRLL